VQRHKAWRRGLPAPARHARGRNFAQIERLGLWRGNHPEVSVEGRKDPDQGIRRAAPRKSHRPAATIAWTPPVPVPRRERDAAGRDRTGGERLLARDCRRENFLEGLSYAAGIGELLEALARTKPAANARQRRKQVLEAVSAAAEDLANTPTICRKSYVHETVVTAFENGVLERFSGTLKNCRSPTRRAKVLAQIIATAATGSAGLDVAGVVQRRT